MTEYKVIDGNLFWCRTLARCHTPSSLKIFDAMPIVVSVYIEQVVNDRIKRWIFYFVLLYHQQL